MWVFSVVWNPWRNQCRARKTLLRNSIRFGFQEFQHRYHRGGGGPKMKKTIGQILLRDSDIESVASYDTHIRYKPNTAIADHVLVQVKESSSSDDEPQSSSPSRAYQIAISNGYSRYDEPARESFVTARISVATTLAGSIKNFGEDYRDHSFSSEVNDQNALSSDGPIGGSINKPHKANDSRWEAIQAVRAHDGSVELSHFRLLRRLGCGDIGSVYLAELSCSGSYFAMKVMDKETLEAKKKLPRARTEREILQCLDHPFLPTLYMHFETDRYTCLVIEYCPGGDLHILRQRQPRRYFTEHAARFYVAEVLLALEYLHMLGIIYRDLKPENVLVREDGHIMLSDFDLSLRCPVSPTLVKFSRRNKSLSDMSSSSSSSRAGLCLLPSACMQPPCFTPPRFLTNSRSSRNYKLRNIGDHFSSDQLTLLPELLAEPTGARSMSFVGTHEYLAPEIIKGEGHGSAVDWWTFGIFLYELLFGRTPFKGSGNAATLYNVVGEPLKFPEVPAVSFAARDLIRGLLVKEPQQRLAYRRGATEVKQHPFFQSVNWALVRCASPPEIPNPSD